MKLCLGTASFDMDYGVSNTSGIPRTKEINEILNLAKENNISFLDTAPSYGNAQKIISDFGAEWTNLITKLGVENSPRRSDYLNSLHNSLKILKKSEIYGILIHRPEFLEGANKKVIWSSLREMKSNNMVNKIGYSLYDTENLGEIYNQFKPDFIQIPMNVFDTRFYDSLWLQKFKDDGVEVFVRSIFLQGLLLMEEKKIDNYFVPWKYHLRQFHTYCHSIGVKPIDYCIQFIKSFSEIDAFIFGVQKKSELQEVIHYNSSSELSYKISKSKFSTTEKGLIDPRNWK